MGLIFIGFSITAFWLEYFGSEADINFEGLIFTRALRNLKGLYSFLSIVGKSAPHRLSLLVLSNHIYNQRQLNNPVYTFGNCSKECLSACSYKRVSISIIRSVDCLKAVQTS